MREKESHDSAVCELLLVLFSLGALLCILSRRGMFDLPFLQPGEEERWIAVILALDASMAGSLLSWYVLPVTTLAFGAVSALAGVGILDLDFAWWRRLILLIVTAALHFLLCGWSLGAASEMRRLLAGRGHRRRFSLVSLALALLTAVSAALVLYLCQHGLI